MAGVIGKVDFHIPVGVNLSMAWIESLVALLRKRSKRSSETLDGYCVETRARIRIRQVLLMGLVSL
jgi:hypothetical protein